MVTSERGHEDSIGDLKRAELEGFEEVGGHCRYCCWIGCWMWIGRVDGVDYIDKDYIYTSVLLPLFNDVIRICLSIP